MLTENQLEKLVEEINSLEDTIKQISYISNLLRFSLRLAYDVKKIPDQIDKFLSKEQQEHIRYLYNQLDFISNKVSYLQSFVDRDGNFIITPPDDDWDDWAGTSSASTRLADELFKANIPSEDAIDILCKVLFCDRNVAERHVKDSYCKIPGQDFML